MGHFLRGVETVKRFVNIHLHCNVSNLKQISKMSTFHPLEKFLLKPMATFTLSTSFDVWASQAKPGVGNLRSGARCGSFDDGIWLA